MKKNTLFRESINNKNQIMSDQSFTEQNEEETNHQRPNGSIACSFYINACFPVPEVYDGISHETANKIILPITKLRESLNRLDLKGQYWLYETTCGIIVSFSKHDDAEKLFVQVNLAQVLDSPVQVAMLPMTVPITQASIINSSVQSVIIRDVPWSVPIEDLRAALTALEINIGEMERWRQHVRAEIRNILQIERLVNEGLDFYGMARFPVTLEKGSTNQGDHHQSCVGDADILQCYRCQGFWHVAANCRHLPRCVRCGEPHAVEFCLRMRNNPLCCNCSGPHHAAYKQCPVRKQMSQASPVSFIWSKTRPAERLGSISVNSALNKSSCLL